MRAEGKTALIVVLIVIGAAVAYFVRLGPQGQSTQRPKEVPASKDSEIPLLGPSDKTPVSPVRTAPPAKPKPAGGDKHVVISLKPQATKPTTQPISEKSIIIRPRVQRPATEPTTKPAPAKEIYVVKPDDSLYRIAEKHYGRGELWPMIRDANPSIIDPTSLRVGQKLVIPPKADAVWQLEGKDTLPAGVDRSAVRPYTVKPGESFYTIARDQLGAAEKWRELFELNKTRVQNDPKKLRAGQTIFLPKK